MKKYICILAVLLLLLALAGCNGEDGVTEGFETIAQETETESVQLTEQELLEMFAGYAQEDWTVINCVIFDGSGSGISGVVQYTTEDYDGCMFDFIKDGNPLRVGVEAQPAAGNAVLEYAGGDRIVCRLKNADGAYTCSITCAVDDGQVDFQIAAEEEV